MSPHRAAKTVFREIAEGLWVGDRPFVLMGVDLMNRMVVIKLKDGNLLIVSPNKFDEDIVNCLKQLGIPAYFVAPNSHHNLFFQEYKDCFPEAKFYANPNLYESSKNFRFDEAVKTSGMPWSHEVECVSIDGLPNLDEHVFFHKASKSIVVCDLGMNFQQSRNTWEKFFYKMIGAWRRYNMTLFARLSIQDKKAFLTSIDKVLQWPFERILVLHGDIVEGQQVKADFKKAYPFPIR